MTISSAAAAPNHPIQRAMTPLRRMTTHAAATNSANAHGSTPTKITVSNRARATSVSSDRSSAMPWLNTSQKAEPAPPTATVTTAPV